MISEMQPSFLAFQIISLLPINLNLIVAIGEREEDGMRKDAMSGKKVR